MFLCCRMFDTDRDGTIGFNEFWYDDFSPRPLSSAVLLKKSHLINVFECYSGLWGFLAAWRALFDRFDADHSGNISYDEFSNALAGEQNIFFNITDSLPEYDLCFRLMFFIVCYCLKF